jgi:hypothetical protein
MKRLLRVIVVEKHVENKRDVDGKHSRFQGVFELVPVIDVIVEVRQL